MPSLPSGTTRTLERVDNQADLSSRTVRNAVADKVLRAERPLTLNAGRWEFLRYWAIAQQSGQDAVPPTTVSAIVSCRWPYMNSKLHLIP